MQSPADVSINQLAMKVNNNTVSGAHRLMQSLPITNAVQTLAVPNSQSLFNPSTITAARIDKTANAVALATNNRSGTSALVSITPFHLPKGSTAVANISVPKGKVTPPVIRAASASHSIANATVSSSTTPGFVPALSRPVTTYMVTTTSSNILQKPTTLNVLPSSCLKSANMMTVTSRISAPIVTKPSEIAVKPLILHNPSKQMIMQTNNQILDRSANGGVLKTNLGMVTIRGSTITPNLQSQNKVSAGISTSQSPRLTTVNVPMLVPTSPVVRKPQTLIPKIITQPTRAPFTVQSIPVSVSHTPSALAMNKKSAGITVANNQAVMSGQTTTTIVRANPTVIGSNSTITVAEIRPTVPLSANLLIQASSNTQNSAPSSAGVTAFSAPNKTLIYDSDNFQLKRALVSSSTPSFTSSCASYTTTPIPRHHFNVVTPVNTNQIPQLNPIMVMETPGIATTVAPTSPNSLSSSALTIQQYVVPHGSALEAVKQQFQTQTQQTQVSQLQSQQQQQSAFQSPRMSPIPQTPMTIKTNASPRPSILRKRDIDGSLAKAQRNLTPLLNFATETCSSMSSPPASPQLSDIKDGQSSNSSTLSATSSPGIPIIDPESPITKVDRIQQHSQNDEENTRNTASLIEMSPRKKPRKQQLTACTNNERKLEDDMEFICDDKKKNEPRNSDVMDTMCNNQEFAKSSSSSPSSSSRKPNISILTGYNHGWKSRHHHFLRYSDVKYKEEKKNSVSDIANQKYVTQKINGWKIYHLSAQMEYLRDIEIEVVDKLSTLLKLFNHSSEDDGDKSLNKINELVMGNMQRSKVVCDQLKEAKSQMLKVFNHKKHVSDIINKYASKRTIRKKGRC